MKIEILNASHVEAAARLAIAQYYEEQAALPILPGGDFRESLGEMIAEMIDDNLGVAAIEDGEVVGFLTCYKPRNNHFGTTLGTFSPVHAHGAIMKNRKRLYSLLYQAAAAKWVSEGILSHAIALYAHDIEAVESFFWNGFGLRCVDAIRTVEPISCGDISGFTFGELPIEEIAQIIPLKILLREHLRGTPMFIPLSTSLNVAQIKEENANRKSRYFIAKDRDQVIAFLKIMESGENFACDALGMTNICGAYLRQEYRNTGVFTKLLSYLLEILRGEGYTLCGVDYESLNPTAHGFWGKHFTPYTHSVTRRIDERIYQVKKD